MRPQEGLLAVRMLFLKGLEFLLKLGFRLILLPLKLLGDTVNVKGSQVGP